MRRIELLWKRLNEAGESARRVERSGMLRIYLDGHGRDSRAYLDFGLCIEDRASADEDIAEDMTGEGLFRGACLTVFSDCNQTPKWITNRRKQVKHAIMLRLNELFDLPVCGDWREVIL